MASINVKIQRYRYDDALGELWIIVYLNLVLSFLVGMPTLAEGSVGGHAIYLFFQALSFAAALKYGSLDKRAFILGLFLIYGVTTCGEAYVWASQLTGVLRTHGSGEYMGKGSLFAFVFKSPPYIYPLLRVASIAYFVPIFRQFTSSVWEGDSV